MTTHNNEAAAVDPLAVMVVAEQFAAAYSMTNTASDFAAARAAVAELVAESKVAVRDLAAAVTALEILRQNLPAAEWDRLHMDGFARQFTANAMNLRAALSKFSGVA